MLKYGLEALQDSKNGRASYWVQTRPLHDRARLRQAVKGEAGSILTAEKGPRNSRRGVDRVHEGNLRVGGLTTQAMEHQRESIRRLSLLTWPADYLPTCTGSACVVCVTSLTIRHLASELPLA